MLTVLSFDQGVWESTLSKQSKVGEMLYTNHHSIRQGKNSKANKKENCSKVGDILK